MTCSDCDELRLELEEQKARVVRYEEKIRDTVKAYKMLESQKQSLEVALSVLSVEIPGENNNEEQTEPTTSAVEGTEKPQLDQMDALKQAISSLTLVNKRKEMEFKRDRRLLVEAKDELQRRCEQLEQQLKEQKQQSKSREVRRLREQVAEMQITQERAMTEHGMVLAEMQQQYGKEKRNSESLGKQVTEMSQRLAAKDELLKRAEIQLKQMTKMEQEMQALRRKAEMTPTVRVIRDELDNVKTSSEQEMSSFRTRYAMQSAQLRERDARIEQLEQRVQQISERSAQVEQQNIELTAQTTTLEKQLSEAKTRYADIKAECREESAATTSTNPNPTGDLIEQFCALYQQLRTQQRDFDLAATLNLSSIQLARPLSRCSDTTGPISIGMCLTPSSTPALQSAALAESRNTSSASLALVAGANGDDNLACDSCMASRRELDYFKSLIGHLQRKLGALEENHEKTKKEHQNSAEMLRERIVELESSQHRQYTQLTAEAKQRVIDLEEELQKQRIRMLDIVAEKDREIELTKSALATFYAQNYGGNGWTDDGQQPNLPMDPPQARMGSVTPPESPAPLPSREIRGKSIGSRRPTAENRRKDSIGSVTNRRSSVDEQSICSAAGYGPFSSHHPGGQQMDFSASYQSSVNAPVTSSTLRRPISRSSTLHFTNQFSGTTDGTMLAGAAARNIFYEQELCKREQEIGELRNLIRLLELKVRDNEQAMLLKDVQYLQIIETLKEEIRVLEGRLILANSQTNLAYLRNIFVQFLNQNTSNGRKHILKAIGAVLQLTSTEMQRVERWSH